MNAKYNFLLFSFDFEVKYIYLITRTKEENVLIISFDFRVKYEIRPRHFSVKFIREVQHTSPVSL